MPDVKIHFFSALEGRFLSAGFAKRAG